MGKMKAYANFDAYLKDQDAKNQPIIHALRQFVKRVEPGLSESVKWGNGCWLGVSGPVAYVYSAPDYVQFGFLYGSSLKDPEGLLEGDGQYVRHIKVFELSGIDERTFSALLRQAVELRPDRARAAKSAARRRKPGKTSVKRAAKKPARKPSLTRKPKKKPRR